MLIESAIIGVVASLIVAAIKKIAGTTEWKTLALVALVSLVGATGYYYFSQTQYWSTFVEIIIAAGAFYAYFIERFNK